jgi:hypothetical protein
MKLTSIKALLIIIPPYLLFMTGCSPLVSHMAFSGKTFVDATGLKFGGSHAQSY